ncbi:hypothetical protein ABPG77_004064 [Micractinium sp. CCAP 211/92]
MADEAGPSGGGTKAVPPEKLDEAASKFERGIQCIRTNDLEQAVQLFSEVLQVRTQHYGDLAPECASAYYRYGAALLYQAQDSGDVFGAGVKEGEEEEEEEGGAAGEAEDNKENGGKGKSPAAAPVQGGAEEEEEEEGEESGDGGGSDLQLAWENLETAKVIWQREGEDKNAQQLADVHGLLGDVAMESDDFGTAMTELDAALRYLQKFVEEDDRRIAEVQYKRCCALQFSGEVEQALPAVQAACDCLTKRREALLRKLAAPGEAEDAEKTKAGGDGIPREQATRAIILWGRPSALQVAWLPSLRPAESEDVAALLEDLKEKVQELQDLIAQNADTKSMLKGALAQLAAAGGGDAVQPAAPAGGASASAPAAAAPAVKNLGVVGRGTKRINLQPVQTNVPAAAPSATGAAGEPPAKKKRSLEDLMGGDEGGETTIGFGSSAATAPTAAPAPTPAGEAAKAAEAPAVPAFLQAASVAAVYGGKTEEK